MAIGSLELTQLQRDALLATDSQECKDLAESTIVPYSSIISALESIQDPVAKDICARAFDAQATAATLISKLKAEISTSEPVDQAEEERLKLEKKAAEEAAAKGKIADPRKVHLQLASKDFREVNDQSSVQDILAAYQYNYGLLIAKEREHWIQHIDDQVPAVSFELNGFIPVGRSNQYEHIGRQALSIGNKYLGMSPISGVFNEGSGDRILNYSHENGMSILTELANQYDTSGQSYIVVNGQKIVEGLSDVERQKVIKQMLIDANNAVISEGDSYGLISTALGIPVGLLMLYGMLRAIEKSGKFIGKPLLLRPATWVGSGAGWGANQMAAKYDAIMTWAKSSNLTWEKAREIAKSRLSRANEAIQNPGPVNEELKKTQLEDLKDVIKETLWETHKTELLAKNTNYTQDDFLRDIEGRRELPSRSTTIKQEYTRELAKMGKFLPIEATIDPFEFELRIRAIENSSFRGPKLGKFYRKFFEGRGPLSFLSNNRWWSASESWGIGAESQDAKDARETLRNALSKIDAEIGIGIEGDKIGMRLPEADVDAAKGVKTHIDRVSFQSAVAAEGVNENRVHRTQSILDHNSLTDLTIKTPEELKKLQKIYVAALAKNARTNYDDLKDKMEDMKQALDDATEKKDKYEDAGKDLQDLNDKRKVLQKARVTFESEKLEAAKTSLRQMLGELGKQTQANGASERAELKNRISAALSADKMNIEARVIDIRSLVGTYDNAQTDDAKKVGTYVDTIEGAIREMQQVDTHQSLQEARDPVQEAETKFNNHSLPDGEKTDFRDSNRTLAGEVKEIQKKYDQAKEKFETIPQEVRELLEQKTDDEIRQEKVRVDRVVRAQEAKVKSEAERASLRQNVEKTGTRVGVDADNFKRTNTGSLSNAGRSQLADFKNFTSNPDNDFHRTVVEARARGYEIRQEGKKVTIVDTSKPAEAAKVFDINTKAGEVAMYEHLAKLKIITARVRP